MGREVTQFQSKTNWSARNFVRNQSSDMYSGQLRIEYSIPLEQQRVAFALLRVRGKSTKVLLQVLSFCSSICKSVTFQMVEGIKSFACPNLTSCYLFPLRINSYSIFNIFSPMLSIIATDLTLIQILGLTKLKPFFLYILIVCYQRSRPICPPPNSIQV